MPEIQILATKLYKINIDWIPIVVANVDYVVEAAMNEAARRQQGIVNFPKNKSKMKHTVSYVQLYFDICYSKIDKRVISLEFC